MRSAPLPAGAAGIFLAIANAEDEVLSQTDYAKFSEPFDKIVLAGVSSSAPLNVLHLHGDKVYLDRFYKGWPVAGTPNFSSHDTGIDFAKVRPSYSGILMGGIDERNYRTLNAEELKRQSTAAAKEAGNRFILAPGCSVPDESTNSELQKLPQFLNI
ncbi:MAG: uroporphyrinogen decarboxylase family protein [Pyrinomonadaceae bacterium]